MFSTLLSQARAAPLACTRGMRAFSAPLTCTRGLHSFPAFTEGSPIFTRSGCRGYAVRSRFTNVKKPKTQVLEQEAEAAQQQAPYTAPQAQQPVYDSRREEEPQYASQYEALTAGAVQHMRKVYSTLAGGLAIATGSSIFAMATPVVYMHPLIPGLLALAPLMGLYYTHKSTHSAALRNGLYVAFTGLSGVAMAPMLLMYAKLAPAAIPLALGITCGLFGTMTFLAMWAKPGAQLRWGVPLMGGLVVLMACGIGGMFVPITSPWYPLLHSVSLYGGLALFTAYIAYDTQKMIDEYNMGEDDHLKHAADLFIDFKVVFMRVLAILGIYSDD